MSKKHRWFAFGVKCFAATMIFIMTTLMVFEVGPLIETRFFPPVSKLIILSMASTADGTGTLISAEFTKHRDCEYLGISWYRGTRDGQFQRVPVTLQRQAGDLSSPNRPVGTQQAGPWIVAIPISEIKTNSFAELFHRCHGLWVTRTEFFP